MERKDQHCPAARVSPPAADSGDILKSNGSKSLKRNPREAACYYTNAKAISRCSRSSQVSGVDSISLGIKERKTLMTGSGPRYRHCH